MADFYRGKTVRIVVGHGAGGGFDTYSRAIARHLGKHIPGQPNVIVENMPGGGGLVAANHIYGVAPRDGTSMANVIGGIVRAQLLGADGVEFNAAEFRYLGAPNSENTVLMVTQASGITAFEQILGPDAREVVLGDGGVATTNHTASVLTRDVLGASINVVTGYGTTAATELAMERGEVDGQFNDWASSKARTLPKFESREWLLIGQLTERPLQDLPQENVPMIVDFADTDEQRQLLRFGLIVPNQFTRPYFLPPGVPADRAAAMEAAFAATLTDRGFLADAEQANLDINPTSAGDLQRMINDYLAMPEDLRAKLQAILPQT